MSRRRSRGQSKAIRAKPKGHWRKRLLAAVLVPVVLIGLTELVLRLVGFGFPTHFFLRSQAPEGYRYIPNERFGWFFQKAGVSRPHPCVITMPKPVGALRVFVLGESAAMGSPDPTFGFGRILEILLRDQYPERKVEVVNAAMRGINSHVIRSIARECAALQPDVFVLYMGNNEVVGLYGPGYREGYLTPFLGWLRFQQQLRLTRLGQLIWLGVRGHPDAPPTQSVVQDLDFFRRNRVAAGDWRRQAVYRNFERNLRDVVEIARGSGARVLLATVGSNLRDFAPLGSLHRRGWNGESTQFWEHFYQQGIREEQAGNVPAALAQYEQAQTIDEAYAELAYRRARCHLALGQVEEARRHCLRARDLDALPFRADHGINDAIRKVAAEARAEPVVLVDIEQQLAQGGAPVTATIPGLDVFHDHVHFRFDGDYGVARSLFVQATNLLGRAEPPVGPRGNPILSRNECARRLGLTYWDEVNMTVAMVELTRKPPFLDQADHEKVQQAAEERLRLEQERLAQEPADHFVKIYQYALKLAPDDWMLYHNYSLLLSALGKPKEAAEHLGFVVARLPDVEAFRIAYANLLARSGQLTEAREQLAEVLKRKPKSAAARAAMASLARLKPEAGRPSTSR